MKSEVVPTSGFKVRPLSKVVKDDDSNQKSEVRGQRSEVQSWKTDAKRSRLRELTAGLRALEAKLRLGGGPDKIERQHKQGKLTARERIDLLLDKETYAQEIGLLVAYDQYRTTGEKGKGETGSEEEIGAAPGA